MNSKSFDKWLELAYLAGILDGEGHFGVTKQSGNLKKNGQRGITYIALRVRCKMTDEYTLQRLQKFFGGKVKPVRTPSLLKNPKNKPTWEWTRQYKYAKQVMEQIFPFMSPRRKARIIQLLSGDYRTVKETLDAEAANIV